MFTLALLLAQVCKIATTSAGRELIESVYVEFLGISFAKVVLRTWPN